MVFWRLVLKEANTIGWGTHVLGVRSDSQKDSVAQHMMRIVMLLLRRRAATDTGQDTRVPTEEQTDAGPRIYVSNASGCGTKIQLARKAANRLRSGITDTQLYSIFLYKAFLNRGLNILGSSIEIQLQNCPALLGTASRLYERPLTLIS